MRNGGEGGTWRAMEVLYQAGKVRAIGVTNYSMRHLKQLLALCRIKPMVNQVEFHPWLVQSDRWPGLRSHTCLQVDMIKMKWMESDGARGRMLLEIPQYTHM